MAEPKISLSLLVPGAGLLSSQECEENSKNTEVTRVTIGYQKGKKYVKETLTIHTRKSRLVTQHININKDSYEEMCTTCPNAQMKKQWGSMNRDARLKAHFDLIAHDLGAVSYSYEILKD